MSDLALMNGIGAKMRYLNARQQVISQNISNADTPNYRPQDLGPVNFGKVLDKVMTRSKSGIGPSEVSVAQTNPAHMALDDAKRSRVVTERAKLEVSPDKNAISLEEQSMKANDVQMNYNLMINTYRSNMEMLRTSITRNGR
jgi:flagellar basal-body rod protein FlgB